MATYQAIAAVSTAMRVLLETSVTPETAGAEFKVVNADSLQSPIADGVGIFLYRVTADPVVHGLQPPDRHFLAMSPHYLVIAWSPDTVRQQMLLGWALRVFEDSPLMSATFLNQNGPAPDVFRPDEKVELISETLTIQDEVAIWNAAKAWQQPSVAYVCRGVRIEPLG